MEGVCYEQGRKTWRDSDIYKFREWGQEPVTAYSAPNDKRNDDMTPLPRMNAVRVIKAIHTEHFTVSETSNIC